MSTMHSALRFLILCVTWALVIPFIVASLLTSDTAVTAWILGVIAAATLIAGPAWVAAGMANRSRWDAVSRYCAMLLLVVICFAVISGVEIFLLRSSSPGHWC